ncbi:MAG: MBOAT family protein [Lachnospiraceae bacterium]|jgi:alginate O-acetyltransferase complex protein AlgI|nr:MBOAT family protein [Lachnospiraceae bacterium]
MVFSSPLFLFTFLPLIFLLYYAIPPRFLKARNIALLAASLVFYAWGEPVVVFLMVVSILVNYALARAIARLDKQKAGGRFLLLFVALVFDLGLLGCFKYANFLTETADLVFRTGFVTDIALPIGISFYTFQTVSYIIDIYRGSVSPERNVVNFALYIAFFPQLIAGPIIRYADVKAQLAKRKHSLALVASGFQRLIIGLAKKVLIANQLAPFVDYAFAAPTLTAVMAWTGAICFALQVYFDFSGYSDMAIGLARMFGFSFRENFDYPYIASSVRDFWRRWHISLSNWFRDYLYIPLGGNRKGAKREGFNLLFVFALTGFWHGASWTFIVWGLYYGLFLVLERYAFKRALKKLPYVAKWGYTMTVVLIGWVFFRAPDLASAFRYLKCMFAFTSGGWSVTLAHLNIIVVAAMLLGLAASGPLFPCLAGKIERYENRVLAGVGSAAYLALLAVSLVFLVGSGFNPFLYFRF